MLPWRPPALLGPASDPGPQLAQAIAADPSLVPSAPLAAEHFTSFADRLGALALLALAQQLRLLVRDGERGLALLADALRLGAQARARAGRSILLG